jgi:hypothetical protein
VLAIPLDLAARIPEATAKVVAREQRIMGCCQSPAFSLEELRRVFES